MGGWWNDIWNVECFWWSISEIGGNVIDSDIFVSIVIYVWCNICECKCGGCSFGVNIVIGYIGKFGIGIYLLLVSCSFGGRCWESGVFVYIDWFVGWIGCDYWCGICGSFK